MQVLKYLGEPGRPVLNWLPHVAPWATGEERVITKSFALSCARSEDPDDFAAFLLGIVNRQGRPPAMESREATPDEVARYTPPEPQTAPVEPEQTPPPPQETAVQSSTISEGSEPDEATTATEEQS